MRTLWCLMVFFTQPQESEAGQTFENRHQKQEAIPQLLSWPTDLQAALPWNAAYSIAAIPGLIVLT